MGKVGCDIWEKWAGWAKHKYLDGDHRLDRHDDVVPALRERVGLGGWGGEGLAGGGGRVGGG